MSRQDKGKKKIKLPGFLMKLKVDRRLQVVVLAVAAAAGVLFFLNAYSMRYVTTLEYASAAVTEQSVYTDLQQGSGVEGGVVWLASFSENEAVYRKGGNYYIGNSYTQILSGLPLYMNDGDYLKLLTSDGMMIMEDWSEEQPAAGSYISNGTVSNFDESDTGDDTVLFLRLSNGLYVNTKLLTIKGTASSLNLTMNSILCISEEGINYYVRSGDTKIVYGTFTQIYGATVEIDDQEMTWEEFLYNLGILTDDTYSGSGTSAQTDEDGNLTGDSGNEAEEEKEIVITDEDAYLEVAESDADESAEGTDETADAADVSDETTETADTSDETASTAGTTATGSGTSSSASTGSGGSSSGSSSSGSSGSSSSGTSTSSTGSSSSGTSTADSDSASAGDTTDTGSSDGTSTGASTGSGSGTGTEGSTGTEESVSDEEGSETDTESSIEDGGDGDGSGSGEGTTVEIEWAKPEVDITGTEADVYSFEGSLEVEDTAGAFNRVVLTFEWENESGELEVQYRKTLRSAGNFYVDNLPPGTEITVKAYLQYYDEDGKKYKETDYFYSETFTTLEFSEVEYVFLDFEESEEDSLYIEQQLKIYNLTLSGANSYLVNKITSGTVYIYQEGVTDYVAAVTLSSSNLKNMRYGDYDLTTALSQAQLDPYCLYRYRFEFYDRYGNEFVSEDKVYWGEEDYYEETAESDYVKAGSSGYILDSDAYIYDLEDNDKSDTEGYSTYQSTTLGTERIWGYTRTCKSVPEAEITVQTISEKQTRLYQADMTILIVDEYEALSEEEETEGVGGTAPVRTDGEGTEETLNVYYEICCDDDPTVLLYVIHTVNEDGSITVTLAEEGDEDACTRNYIDTASLSGELTYSVTGLTAGKTYTLKVYAQYDLSDGNGTCDAVQIGSVTFSSLTMASYGRMYYNFSASSVKTEQPAYDSYDHTVYDSATSQEVTMAVNTTRSNATLTYNYYHNFNVTLKDKATSEELLVLQFYRNDEETGVYDDSLPTLSRTLTFYVYDENSSDEDDEESSAGTYCVDEDGNEYEAVYDEDSDTFTWTLKGAAEGSAEAGSADYTYSWSEDGELLNVLPEITLTIPSVGEYLSNGIISMTEDDGTKIYTFDQWYAFISVYYSEDGGEYTFMSNPTVMTYDFTDAGEDGALKSYNSYILSAESYAAQGTVTDHSVTSTSSTYRQVTFTTLKEMPYVRVGGILQIGRYLYVEDIYIYDPDEAIYGGEVTISNLNTRNAGTTDTYVLEYDETLGNGTGGYYIADYEASGLSTGTTYTYDIIPVDIRRTGKTTSPRYQNTAQYFTQDDDGTFIAYTYVAGASVTGSVSVTNTSYPLESETTEDVTVDSYSVYEVGDYEYGYINSSGTDVSGSSATYETTNEIYVEPGEVYYFTNMSSQSYFYLIFLDINGDLLSSARLNRADDGYITVPDGAYYMRATMIGTGTYDGLSYYNCTKAQILKVYDEGDEFLEEYGIVGEAVDLSSGSATLYAEDLANDMDQLAFTAGSGTTGTVSVTVAVTDSSGETSETTVSGYVGFTYDLPDDFESVTVSSGSITEVRAVSSEGTDIFTDYNLDHLVAGYKATVSDANGNLIEENSGNVKVEVTDSEGTLLSDAGLSGAVSYTGSVGSYTDYGSYESESGETYTLTLSVMWSGNWYVLDTATFTAEGTQYTIATETQLAKTMTWPTASFIVTADLGSVSSYTLTVLNQSFGGDLDGDGHSMTVDATNGTLYSLITATGVIENFELTVYTGNSTSSTIYKYPINKNLGTIKNIVLYYNPGSVNVRRNSSAGLCRYNQGTIENFALYYVSSAVSGRNYVGSSFGGICESNSGTIKNGYVYASGSLDVTTGVYKGSTSVSNNSVGGVAGTNTASGLIENVYVLLTMRVEKNSNVTSSSATISGCGLIAGSNSGMIRNCFTNGEVYYGEWEGSSLTGYSLSYSVANTMMKWPGSGSQGSAYTDNDNYFSSLEYNANDAYTTYRSSSSVLGTSAFYSSTVNSDGAFVVDDQLENGYYPIVDMPECMDGLQSNISLNTSGFGTIPSYIGYTTAELSDGTEISYSEMETLDAEMGAELVSILGDEWSDFLEAEDDGTYTVTRQFKVVDFTFSNRNSYLIDNIEIESLNAIVLSSETTDSVATVKTVVTTWLENVNGDLILSTRPASYGSAFTLTSFDYGRTASTMVTRTVESEISLTFYYPLSITYTYQTTSDISAGTYSTGTWNTNTPVSSSSQIVNYRLIEDIRIADVTDSTTLNLILSFFSSYCSSYGGIFDGAGHTLDFEDCTLSYGSYFTQLTGTAELKDLWVKNLTVTSSTSYAYKGLIGQMSSGSYVHGVNVEDITITNPVQYAGGLVGYVTTATIEDCTLNGVKIVTDSSSANSLYAGGIAGYLYNTNLTNSLVRNLDMEIDSGASVSGTGGIAGGAYSSGYSTTTKIRSCYAEGTLETSFANAGGVLGYGGATLNGLWTAVDIYGTSNVGSLVGYVAVTSTDSSVNTFSSNVVVGELYSESSQLENRLVGAWEKDNGTLTQNYAYAGQLINSEVSDDSMDADGVADADLMETYYFWQDLVGYGSDYSLYGDETEGISGIADGVMPILYATDGETILPQQTDIEFETETPDFEVVSAVASLKSSTENYGEYELTIVFRTEDTVSEESSDADTLISALKESVSASGLDLTADGSEWTASQNDDGTWNVTVTGIDAVSRLDSYRLVYTFNDDGDTTGVKITFKESADDDAEDVYLYWMINSASDWTYLMANYGSGYENFMLCSDISLSGTSIATSLKINRLVGAQKSGWSEASYENKSKDWLTTAEFYTISGASSTSLYSSWIAEINTQLAYIGFNNITLTASTSFSSFGIMASLVGTAEYVDFSNITLTTGSQSGTLSYLGCIAYSSGTIENIRLADISIKPVLSTRRYSYVGGLAGYAANADNVYAFADDEGGYYIDMGDSSTSISESYCGGVVGYTPNYISNVTAEGLKVSGRDYVGGIVGYTWYNTDSDSDDDPVLEAIDCTVTGRNYVGGVAGRVYNTPGTRSMSARDCTVTANVSYAGGVAGDIQYGTLYYAEAYNCTVTADASYAGGIAGAKSVQGGIYYSVVYGCSVKASSYSGGVLGYGYSVMTANSVTDTTVKATVNAAGGIAGYIANGNLVNGTSNYLEYNVVSGDTAVTAKNYAGGVVGNASGSQLSYNEVTDTVAVTASTQYGGGLAGYLSGGVVSNNIVAASVEGGYIGGLIGSMLGYGECYVSGAEMSNYVAMVYGNIVASEYVKGTGAYVAGLIGYFDPGSEPVDADGNVISDSGYVSYMTSDYFYGNVIVAKEIAAYNTNNEVSYTSYTTWYANCSGSDNYFDKILSNNGLTQRYDAFSTDYQNYWWLDMPSNASDSAVTDELVSTGAVPIDETLLKTENFYTTAITSGGLGFGSSYVDTSDVANIDDTAYYPYIMYSSVIVPYQTSDTANSWNSYYETDATEKTYYSGVGIEISVGSSDEEETVSVLTLMTVLPEITVYASGINTINIDFSGADSTLVTFAIMSADGSVIYLEETELETLGSTPVCSLTYDFVTDFEVVLYSEDHETEEVYCFEASDLCSTVMAWENEQYYIKSDGVYRIVQDSVTSDTDDGDEDDTSSGSSELVLEGSFVHLYDGQALSADGTVYSLDDYV